jgi:hypothetical protein
LGIKNYDMPMPFKAYSENLLPLLKILLTAYYKIKIYFLTGEEINILLLPRRRRRFEGLRGFIRAPYGGKTKKERWFPP